MWGAGALTDLFLLLLLAQIRDLFGECSPLPAAPPVRLCCRLTVTAVHANMLLLDRDCHYAVT